jgi:hypothetical protein
MLCFFPGSAGSMKPGRVSKPAIFICKVQLNPVSALCPGHFQYRGCQHAQVVVRDGGEARLFYVVQRCSPGSAGSRCIVYFLFLKF